MTLDLKLTSIQIGQGNTDGEVTVTIKPKYSDARRYSLPRECLEQMMADIKSLATNGQAKPAATPNQVTLRAPKKWMVGSGLPKHEVVVLVFDPQTEAQGGFALSAEAATEMAAALVKNAEGLKTKHPGPSNGGNG